MNDQAGANASNLIKVRRHSDISISYLTIDYGVTDDPTDELVLFMLTLHPDTLALTGEALDNFIDTSFWLAAQNWRAVGTPANVIQTLSREQVIIGEAVRYTDESIRLDTWSVGILVASDAQSAVRVDGTVNWTETLYQRSWPSRAGSEWSGWGAGMDGENYGQFS